MKSGNLDDSRAPLILSVIDRNFSHIGLLHSHRPSLYLRFADSRVNDLVSLQMHALAYRVTKHIIPGWVPFHEKEPRGIAYEGPTHFIHIFGKDFGMWVVSTGLTATEAKSGTLREWIDRVFGATDVVDVARDVGHTSRSVWRPGLYYDDEVLKGLNETSFELRLAEQSLLLLIQRLDELLHFVEPTPSSLSSYSHKARELLILSCTEVENFWASFLRLAGKLPPKSLLAVASG